MSSILAEAEKARPPMVDSYSLFNDFSIEFVSPRNVCVLFFRSVKNSFLIAFFIFFSFVLGNMLGNGMFL